MDYDVTHVIGRAKSKLHILGMLTQIAHSRIANSNCVLRKAHLKCAPFNGNLDCALKSPIYVLHFTNHTKGTLARLRTNA